LLVTTLFPFTAKLPVIDTLPVNWCVLVDKLPKRVEPVTKSVDDVMVWATIVWAVNVPLTKKLSADDAVVANEEERTVIELVWLFVINEAVFVFNTYGLSIEAVTDVST
jgi:hypothetical protein